MSTLLRSRHRSDDENRYRILLSVLMSTHVSQIDGCCVGGTAYTVARGTRVGLANADMHTLPLIAVQLPRRQAGGRFGRNRSSVGLAFVCRCLDLPFDYSLSLICPVRAEACSSEAFGNGRVVWGAILAQR